MPYRFRNFVKGAQTHDKKQKKMLIRIIIAAVMLAALHFIPVTGWLRLALYLVTYVVIGYDIMKKAGQGILNLPRVRRELSDGRGHHRRLRSGHL